MTAFARIANQKLALSAKSSKYVALQITCIAFDSPSSFQASIGVAAMQSGAWKSELAESCQMGCAQSIRRWETLTAFPSSYSLS